MNTHRVTSFEDLEQWIGSAQARGATRFELWQKPHGYEQRRLLSTGERVESWTVADDFFAAVERERRQSEPHVVSYAVFAYRGEDASPVERVFVSPMPAAVAMPMMAADAGMPAPILAMQSMQSMIATAQHMTNASFSALQKENEQQRRSNETLVRASHGHFETFAHGYERTFADLQRRLEEALSHAAEARAKADMLERELKVEKERTKTLEQSNHREQAEIDRKKKVQDVMRQSFDLLAPVALAKITNSPLSGALGNTALKRFFDSLSPAQIQAVMAPLDNSQQVLVTQIVSAYREMGTDAPPSPPSPSPVSDCRPLDASPAAAPDSEEDDFSRLISILEDRAKNARFNAWMQAREDIVDAKLKAIEDARAAQASDGASDKTQPPPSAPKPESKDDA